MAFVSKGRGRLSARVVLAPAIDQSTQPGSNTATRIVEWAPYTNRPFRGRVEEQTSNRLIQNQSTLLVNPALGKV
jgi:hypothetical protein